MVNNDSNNHEKPQGNGSKGPLRGDNMNKAIYGCVINWINKNKTGTNPQWSLEELVREMNEIAVIPEQSLLSELCLTLGWQGGTRHQVLERVQELVRDAYNFDTLMDKFQDFATPDVYTNGFVISQTHLSIFLDGVCKGRYR